MYEPVIYLIQEFLLSTYELVLYITIYTYIILCGKAAKYIVSKEFSFPPIQCEYSTS